MGVCRKRGECSPRAWSVSNCDRWAASPACSGQPPSSLGAGTVPSVRPREGTRRSGAPGPEALSCPQPPSVLRPAVTASVRPGAARRQRGTRGRGAPEQHTVVPGGTFGPMQTKGVWFWGPAPAGANGRFVCFINSGLSCAETGRRGEASCRRVRPPQLRSGKLPREQQDARVPLACGAGRKPGVWAPSGLGPWLCAATGLAQLCPLQLRPRPGQPLKVTAAGVRVPAFPRTHVA